MQNPTPDWVDTIAKGVGAVIVTCCYLGVSWLIGDFANDNFELGIESTAVKAFTGAGIGFTCLYFYLLIQYLFEE